MSFTNKTANYELPQYVADDKPTFLGDFNKAMLDIDTNLKTVDNKATEAQSTSQNANSTADEALETAQSAESSALSANTNATEAKTMAQNAQTDASTAISTANSANENANNAKSNAENAINVANSANSTAQSANTTAQSANQNVNDLNQAVDGWLEGECTAGTGGTKPGSIDGIHCKYNKKLGILAIFGGLNYSQINKGDCICILPEFVDAPAKNKEIYNCGSCYAQPYNFSAILRPDRQLIFNSAESQTALRLTTTIVLKDGAVSE